MAEKGGTKILAIITICIILISIGLSGCVGNVEKEYKVDIYVYNGTPHWINITLNIDNDIILILSESTEMHGGTLKDTILLKEGNHKISANESISQLNKSKIINIHKRTYIEIAIQYTTEYNMSIRIQNEPFGYA